MAMHNQLPRIPLRRRGHPQRRKPLLHQQTKNMAGIAPIRLLPAHIAGPDGCRVADLAPMPHLLQHLLEPLRVTARLYAHQHLLSLKRGIKPLRLLPVRQTKILHLAALSVQNRDLLKPGMKIASYNHHDVGSFLRAKAHTHCQSTRSTEPTSS
jgi:hypothetical protein